MLFCNLGNENVHVEIINCFICSVFNTFVIYTVRSLNAVNAVNAHDFSHIPLASVEVSATITKNNGKK